jgi:branched-chain amino acid transport system substrate-binding protein
MIPKSLVILLSVISILFCFTEIQCSAKDEIVIGSILPLSGFMSPVGLEMKNGMKLALQEVNSDSGFMGHSIKIVFEDTKSNPQGGNVAVRKLIERDNVPLILGSLSVSVNLVTGKITNRNKVVQIAIGPGIDRFTEIGPYFFSVVGFIDDLGSELAKFISDASDPNTAGFFTINSPFESIIQVNAEKYFKVQKIRVVANIFSEPKQTDFFPELFKLHKAKPEIVLLTAFSKKADSILNQANEIGFPRQKSGWYVPYIDWLTNYITQETSNGLAGITIGVDEELHRDFVARYEKVFKETPSRTLSAYAYDTTKMAALAIKVVNSKDPDKLKQALFDVSKTYCGISGKKRFNEKGMQVSQIYSRFIFKQGELTKFEPCPVPPWCKKIKY